MDDLRMMLTKQLKLQRHLASQKRAMDPTDPSLTQDQRIQFVKDMYIALTKEVGEVLDEVGWKPWGTSRHINGEAMLREIVDAWHFVMNLMLLSGPFIEGVNNEVELADLFVQFYNEKHAVNWERAMSNYNGFAEKCAYCGRDREEVESHGVIIGIPPVWYCSIEHYQEKHPEATVKEYL